MKDSRGCGGRVAVIGGLDPSGGAGLLRDAWTIEGRAPGLELHAVCTALTRQGEGGPARAASAEPSIFVGELERLASLERLGAIKLGMVPAEQVDALEEFLARLRARPTRPWIVCDPVGSATAGGRLGAPAGALLRLAARVDLLTPNLAELAELREAGSLPDHIALLCKGEPVPGRPDRIRDRLRLADGSEQVFERPRVTGPDPRGTGCALASAIACELALGRSLITAVAAAVAWLDGARRRPLRVAGSWHLPR
ncbi:MAG: bifunctional hydroxymethylpyrimidine kinase/phosphomethylpyrimidine kinase [Enhygromyxa sp.]